MKSGFERAADIHADDALKGIIYDHDKVKVATTLTDCRRRLVRAWMRFSVSSFPENEVLQEDGITPPTNIANLVFILVCSLTISAYFLTTNS